MRIDPRVEEHVREAYRGVIAKNGDRMVAAFRDLNADDSATAVAYGMVVVGTVVNDAFPDGPTETELLGMARKIVDEEGDWIDLGDPHEIARLLSAAARGDTTFPGTNKADVVGHLFVSGGHLLGVYRDEGQNWWNYLEEIWHAVEAAPEPTS